MPRLTQDEVDRFLAEPGHLLRIATVDEDGWPRLVPTWFIHRDGEIVFTPRGTSRFLDNIRREPRLCLSIDETPLPYRKVTVQGTARILREPGEDDAWRDLYRTIAKRYVPVDAADAYVDDTIDQPRALIGVALASSRVTTWRMPVEDEDKTGIWARHYYLPGTRMALAAGTPEARGAYVP